MDHEDGEAERQVAILDESSIQDHETPNPANCNVQDS